MDKLAEADTIILYDRPSGTDEFGGKGHERTASALADTIVQLCETGGAIGLDGQWGAGKSTVIALADKFLRARTHGKYEYRIFTFDLWTHQTDPFKRSFLEEFIDWIETEQVVGRSVIDEKRDLIRDRHKTIKTQNTRVYNFFGLTFLAIAPLIPVIYMGCCPGRLFKRPWPIQMAF